jgi:HAD superfamily hydrolase (TIGR01490 family)
LPALFKDFSRDEAQRAFKWVVDNYFNHLMRPEVVEELNEHKKQGHKIVLLSGVFMDFLEVVGKTMEADYVVGTKLEIVNDVYSGHIIQPLCFGENKAKLLSEFIRNNHLEVDLKQSSAYADSIFDSPVFQMVGNPVAVYPDKELLKLAQEKKWRVID